jgi:hypothetical protein
MQECSNCFNKEICGVYLDFAELKEKAQTLSNLKAFEIEVKCKHFSSKGLYADFNQPIYGGFEPVTFPQQPTNLWTERAVNTTVTENITGLNETAMGITRR